MPELVCVELRICASGEAVRLIHQSDFMMTTLVASRVCGGLWLCRHICTFDTHFTGQVATKRLTCTVLRTLASTVPYVCQPTNFVHAAHLFI